MKPHRHHTAALNIVDLVMRRNMLLSAEDVALQKAIGRDAIAGLEGPGGLTHWRSLADTANIAETLAGMGLGSGPEATRVIDEAQQALGAVFEHRRDADEWRLTPADREALEWLICLHETQLKACTYGEFETAYRRTAERLRQAVAGNAPRGTVVVTGEIGRVG